MSEQEQAPDHPQDAQNSDPSKEKRIAALKPYQFKPGESGNPGGRPRMQPITELYKKILADPKNMADFEKSVVGIIKDGRMASMFQLKEMAERIEGKVTQSLEVKTELRDMTEAELLAKLELLRKEAE